MVALPLVDAVLSSGQPLDRSQRVAAQAIEAALSELDQVEAMDESLAPADPTQLDARIAALLRDMYETWAREAESLLGRLDRFERSRGPVSGVRRLRDAHGRTRAMLSITPEASAEGRRDVAEGRLVPAEEVRRELRAGLR